jgi:hypothetical protein
MKSGQLNGKAHDASAAILRNATVTTMLGESLKLTSLLFKKIE